MYCRGVTDTLPVGDTQLLAPRCRVRDKAMRGVKGPAKNKDKYKWGPKYMRKDAELKGGRTVPAEVHSAIMDELDMRGEA